MDTGASPPQNGDAARRREQLVDLLRTQSALRPGPIEAAFRAVPRHLFLPGAPLDQVYSDQAIPTKWIDGSAVSSSSQPAIMVAMLEQLDLQSGQSVLEIGAATGYNAALLAHVVGPDGRVVTLDIDEDLVAGAREHLAAAGIENVEVVCADGANGWPARAPYDRIIVTSGAWDIAPPWREQLSPGGRLVLPLSLPSNHLSIAFEEVDGILQSRSLQPCSFLTLRGVMAGPATVVCVAGVPGLTLFGPDAGAVSADLLAASLASPAEIESTGFILAEEDCQAVGWWITLHEPSTMQWWQTAEGAQQQPLPALWVFPDGNRTGVAIATTDAIALLAVGTPEAAATADDRLQPVKEALVHCYGPADDVPRRLRSQLHAWDAAGRPGLDELSVRAYPAGEAPKPADGEVRIARPRSELLISWRNRPG